ncbi:5-dehydro-4-deoxy-D-glucuronate isomerase [Saccharothrix syringae]|uniref:4-deoxy-L-threo-5-hexosulose-uronate ketol-isomerase n=1 Tax=Saccharothrix syringae TaxID=103733 RepID=A0A5Q0H459_SACSY|nr:5-dehydro-4-deoxy-D-glucuronate isomerase [Saccharothrix syringae]QFZ21008.1 5-dehydro-4-deoxy-D-glucuronate isomerase [Saccharothrix syringae]
MEQRHATAPQQVPGMSTAELRRHYLVEDLFAPDEVRAVHSHHDRVVLVGAVPRTGPLPLPAFPELRADRFFDRREAGIVNVGGAGAVTVDGEEHRLAPTACLYVGRGAEKVSFASADADSPAAFYLFSAPAHASHPTVLVEPGGGTVRELGDPLTSNRRTLTQYVHEGGVRSCQVVMGVTALHPGSTWNTMPAHTHERRTEVYLYFGVPEDARVVHLLGEPDETRHLVVADRQVVISPPWSVHSGVGTASYSFVWAMAGENQSFDDMDPHPVTGLR